MIFKMETVIAGPPFHQRREGRGGGGSGGGSIFENFEQNKELGWNSLLASVTDDPLTDVKIQSNCDSKNSSFFVFSLRFFLCETRFLSHR